MQVSSHVTLNGFHSFKTEKRFKRVNSLISMLSAFASSIQIKKSTLSHRFSITKWYKPAVNETVYAEMHYKDQYNQSKPHLVKINMQVNCSCFRIYYDICISYYVSICISFDISILRNKEILHFILLCLNISWKLIVFNLVTEKYLACTFHY